MKKLLIVDDDWHLTESLRTLSEWVQHDIDVIGTANNGKEALFCIEKEIIDYILTDIRMPQMDGISLAEYLSINVPDIKLILMSGYQEFTYAQKAIKYNARGYILKPFDTTELFEVVKRIRSEDKQIIMDNKTIK